MFYVFKHFQEGKLAEMAEGLERGRGSSAIRTRRETIPLPSSQRRERGNPGEKVGQCADEIKGENELKANKSIFHKMP